MLNRRPTEVAHALLVQTRTDNAATIEVDSNENSPKPSTATHSGHRLAVNLLYALALLLFFSIVASGFIKGQKIVVKNSGHYYGPLFDDAIFGQPVGSTNAPSTIMQAKQGIMRTRNKTMRDINFPEDVNSEEYLYLYGGEPDGSRLRNVTLIRLQTLVRCLEASNCTPYQEVVVILGTQQYKDALVGKVSGDAIWAGSMLTAADALGFTVLPVDTPHEALLLYHIVGNLTAIVALENPLIEECWNNRRNPGFRCMATDSWPMDIPVWKMVAALFWPGYCLHPLGEPWCFTPENYQSWTPLTKTSYIGYSIEDICMQTPVIPWADRLNRTFILAKSAEYFRNTKIDTAIFAQLANTDGGAGISFVTAVANDGEFAFAGVTNLPAPMPRAQYTREVGQSKALLGLGDPRTSPSAYDALCAGVAFFNPIKSWDRQKPWDRERWETQHDGVKYMDPPRVYNFFVDDAKELKLLLLRAMVTDVGGRFIPDHMTMRAMRTRMEEFVLRDWKKMADDVREMRKEFGGESISHKNIQGWMLIVLLTGILVIGLLAISPESSAREVQLPLSPVHDDTPVAEGISEQKPPALVPIPGAAPIEEEEEEDESYKPRDPEEACGARFGDIRPLVAPSSQFVYNASDSLWTSLPLHSVYGPKARAKFLRGDQHHSTGKLRVVTINSDPTPQSLMCETTLFSAALSGIPLEIYGASDFFKDKGMMNGIDGKIDRTLAVACSVDPDDTILMVDAYDVLFQRSWEELQYIYFHKWLEPNFVISTESNCFPPSVKHCEDIWIPKPPPSGIKFINSGVIISKASYYIDILEDALDMYAKGNTEDQWVLTDLVFNKYKERGYAMDHDSELSGSLHPPADYGVFKTKGKIYYAVANSRSVPAILHLNGGSSKEIVQPTKGGVWYFNANGTLVEETKHIIKNYVISVDGVPTKVSDYCPDFPW
ncbi:hypothetical protein HDU83_000281 [Entophlyctis luteolus]|nr:hypothetical protein HDU83_000281 [Entophlyctis luteolus]